MVGRWVQEAAAQAGRRLMVLDLACQAGLLQSRFCKEIVDK